MKNTNIFGKWITVNFSSLTKNFPVPLWERARVRGRNPAPSPQSSSLKPEQADGAWEQIAIAIMLAAMLLFAATFSNAAPLDETLAKRKPEATINLASKDGVQAVKGEWRYSDTKIIETDFKAPDADGQPGSMPNK